MVRRRLIVALTLLAAPACAPQSDMAESADMPDSAGLHEAMTDPARRDALLDSMPGGEMAIGDSVTEMELLEEKMP